MGVVVLVLAVVAVIAGRGSSRPAATAAGLSETRPVTVTGTALPPYTGSGADAAIGLTAPTLRGATFDGTPVAIAADDGRPKLLFFVAHWCPHCQREIPVIADWLRQGGRPGDVDLYIVSTSVSPDAVNYPPSEWLQGQHVDLPILADDAAGHGAVAYGLQGFPYYVAVSASGHVVAREAGELPVASIEQLVAAARKG
jgi:thiol-disulfide isomerase/thioredoxin